LRWCVLACKGAPTVPCLPHHWKSHGATARMMMCSQRHRLNLQMLAPNQADTRRQRLLSAIALPSRMSRGLSGQQGPRRLRRPSRPSARPYSRYVGRLTPPCCLIRSLRRVACAGAKEGYCALSTDRGLGSGIVDDKCTQSKIDPCSCDRARVVCPRLQVGWPCSDVCIFHAMQLLCHCGH